MGNVIGVPPPQPQALVLEETEGEGLSLHLRRTIRNPTLRRIVDRRGTAAEVAVAVGNAGALTEAGGLSGLHIAVAFGWSELVQKLLEDANLDRINAASLEGYTPLHLAAMCGRTAVAQALLDKGADLHKRSRRGASALHFAAQGPQNLGTLRALLAHPSCTPALVNQRGHRQRSALQLALLAHGSVGMVRELLGAGANPSERTPTMANISLLHSCAHLGRVEAMRVLIDAGAAVDAAATDGITVLHECFVQPPSRHLSEATKRQMFRMLVAAGADVNAQVPSTNFTVLHFAMAHCKDEQTARLIADSGCDLRLAVDKPTSMGDSSAKHTMLHLAAMRGWVHMLDRLVAAGANVNERNKEGMTPLHVAILDSQAGAVAALLRAGADPLAACPDCYPSYSRWKRRRGLQAMHALMNGGGPDGLPDLLQLFGGDPLADGTMTAVDLACCVARDIPCVEAFLDAGVLPSAEALALAEQAVPMMRAVVERPLWTPELHRRLPPKFKAAARELVLCLSRPIRGPDGPAVSLPPDAVAAILQKAAFPLSCWARPPWFALQQVRDPPPRDPPAAGADGGDGAAGGQQAQQGPGGQADVEIFEGNEVPPFLQNVLQQVQQELGLGAAQPNIVIMQHPPGGGPPPGMPAAGAGGAPAAAGAGAGEQPGGVPGVHIMQFAIDLPFPVGPGAGGPPALPDLLPGMLPPLPPPGFLQFIEQLMAGGPGEFFFDMDDEEGMDSDDGSDDEGYEDELGEQAQGLWQAAPVPAQDQALQQAPPQPAPAASAPSAGPSPAVQETVHASDGAGPSPSGDAAGPSQPGRSKRPASPQQPTHQYNLRKRQKRE